MAIVELQPLQPPEPYPKWRFEAVDLGGVDYDYEIRWNDRVGAWYLYLQRSDGSTPPVNGVKMVHTWFLAERHVGRAPEGGVLILVDMGAGDDDKSPADRPTFEGLGHRWILMWADEEDIPEIDITPVYDVTVP
jgi:hypothetical protein